MGTAELTCHELRWRQAPAPWRQAGPAQSPNASATSTAAGRCEGTPPERPGFTRVSDLLRPTHAADKLRAHRPLERPPALPASQLDPLVRQTQPCRRYVQ